MTFDLNTIYKLYATFDEVLNKIPGKYGSYRPSENYEWALINVKDEDYVYFISTNESLRNTILSFYKNDLVPNEEWYKISGAQFGRLAGIGDTALAFGRRSFP